MKRQKRSFKSCIEGNKKSTRISERLFEECRSISEFHLILALGYRVKEQAKAQRAVQADKVPRPETYKKIAEMFEVKPNTLMNSLNLAVDFHNRRMTRSDKRRSELDRGTRGRISSQSIKNPEDRDRRKAG